MNKTKSGKRSIILYVLDLFHQFLKVSSLPTLMRYRTGIMTDPIDEKPTPYAAKQQKRSVSLSGIRFPNEKIIIGGR